MTEIPEGIPQDVWEAAMAVSPTGAGHVMQCAFAEVASRAILAEREAQRERDAKIADETAYSRREINGVPALFSYTVDIAAAIRTPA